VIQAASVETHTFDHAIEASNDATCCLGCEALSNDCPARVEQRD